MYHEYGSICVPYTIYDTLGGTKYVPYTLYAPGPRAHTRCMGTYLIPSIVSYIVYGTYMVPYLAPYLVGTYMVPYMVPNMVPYMYHKCIIYGTIYGTITVPYMVPLVPFMVHIWYHIWYHIWHHIWYRTCTINGTTHQDFYLFWGTQLDRHILNTNMLFYM